MTELNKDNMQGFQPVDFSSQEPVKEVAPSNPEAVKSSFTPANFENVSEIQNEETNSNIQKGVDFVTNIAKKIPGAQVLAGALGSETGKNFATESITAGKEAFQQSKEDIDKKKMESDAAFNAGLQTAGGHAIEKAFLGTAGMVSPLASGAFGLLDPTIKASTPFFQAMSTPFEMLIKGALNKEQEERFANATIESAENLYDVYKEQTDGWVREQSSKYGVPEAEIRRRASTLLTGAQGVADLVGEGILLKGGTKAVAGAVKEAIPSSEELLNGAIRIKNIQQAKASIATRDYIYDMFDLTRTTNQEKAMIEGGDLVKTFFGERVKTRDDVLKQLRANQEDTKKIVSTLDRIDEKGFNPDDLDVVRKELELSGDKRLLKEFDEWRDTGTLKELPVRTVYDFLKWKEDGIKLKSKEAKEVIDLTDTLLKFGIVDKGDLFGTINSKSLRKVSDLNRVADNSLERLDNIKPLTQAEGDELLNNIQNNFSGMETDRKSLPPEELDIYNKAVEDFKKLLAEEGGVRDVVTGEALVTRLGVKKARTKLLNELKDRNGNIIPEEKMNPRQLAAQRVREIASDELDRVSDFRLLGSNDSIKDILKSESNLLRSVARFGDSGFISSNVGLKIVQMVKKGSRFIGLPSGHSMMTVLSGATAATGIVGSLFIGGVPGLTTLAGAAALYQLYSKIPFRKMVVDMADFAIKNLSDVVGDTPDAVFKMKKLTKENPTGAAFIQGLIKESDDPIADAKQIRQSFSSEEHLKEVQSINKEIVDTMDRMRNGELLDDIMAEKLGKEKGKGTRVVNVALTEKQQLERQVSDIQTKIDKLEKTIAARKKATGKDATPTQETNLQLLRDEVEQLQKKIQGLE